MKALQARVGLGCKRGTMVQDMCMANTADPASMVQHTLHCTHHSSDKKGILASGQPAAAIMVRNLHERQLA